MHLGEILKTVREDRGLSLDAVAHKTELTDSRICHIEQNGDCSVAELSCLAEVYSKAVIDLLNDSDSLNEHDRRILYSVVPGFEKLSEDSRSHLMESVNALIAEQKPTVFRLGELFCGPGGLAQGARTAQVKNGEYRIEHAWANDFDANTCQTYRKNICPDDPDSVICHDVKTLDYDDLSKISGIDALAFGFPCNDFSQVGEQKGLSGEYGPLYTYGVKALKKFKPKWFLAENVSGLQTADKGKTFNLILSDLKNCGYTITPHLYKFEDYGIPQARHRVIIVGIRDDIEDVVYHVPSPEPYAGLDNTCGTALSRPLPEGVKNNEKTAQSKTVQERLQYIKPGQNAFTAELPEHLKLKVKGAKISQIYKRLDPNKPAYTVTGSGGGGTHMYHWSENRALTNRERARLQTFPDSFVFCGSKESVRKQIGMAVPCEGARIIMEAILKSFAHVDYPSIEPNIRFERKEEESDQEQANQDEQN